MDVHLDVLQLPLYFKCLWRVSFIRHIAQRYKETQESSKRICKGVCGISLYSISMIFMRFSMVADYVAYFVTIVVAIGKTMS